MDKTFAAFYMVLGCRRSASSRTFIRDREEIKYRKSVAAKGEKTDGNRTKNDGK